MNTPDDTPRRRRLRLRRRPEESASSASSLFARLSPSIVTDLANDALCLAASSEDQRIDSSSSTQGWNILSRSNSNAGEKHGRIDFLPLSVTFAASSTDAITIYVSYNGGDASVTTRRDASDEDILELPGCLIPDECGDYSTVHVSVLASVQDADMLQVEPLTSADWELLETRADFLEDGALLQQVSIAYAEQHIPLWVGAKDVAWVRVLPCNFGGESKDSVWPETCDDTSQKKAPSTVNNGCVRLVQDTQICVAPKPRRKKEAPLSPPLRVYTTKSDYSTPMLELAESFGKCQAATTPGTLFLSSAMKALIPGLQADDSSALVVLWNAANGSDLDASSPSCVLQIAFCDDIPDLCIAIHPLTRSRLDVIALVDAVFVRVLSPIEVARGSSWFENNGGTAEGSPLSLASIELNEARTGRKWRYPDEDRIQQKNSWLLPGSRVEDCHAEKSEALEEGSFLFADRETTGDNSVRALHLVSFCSDSEPTNAPESQDRRFVLRQDLPQFSKIISNDALPCTSYNLLSGTFLIGLLSQTYLLPVELMKFKNCATTSFDALVYGENGSGKTQTALALASFARFSNDCSTLYLDCKKLKEGRGIRMKQIQSEFGQLFHEARSCVGHVLVILDDLDELAPDMENGASADESSQSQQVNPVALDQAKLVADTARRYLEECSRTTEKSISILMTCRDIRSLHPALLNVRPFTRTIPAPELTADEREKVLWKMLRSEVGLEKDDSFTSLRLGRKTDGYRPKDLSLLASRVKHALKCSGTEYLPTTFAQCIKTVLEDFTPLRQLSVTEGMGQAAANWSDIGGLFDVKDVLTSTMLNPSKYRLIYSKAKIRLPRGLLIFGSPGCGKSYLVPALAKKCGFSLINCRGPELLDRYIGASESKVRELFARATAASPAVLFFDEIDSLAPRRGSDLTGVTDRVVNQLLTLLDGVEDASAGGLVYVVAATSRPDVVDPALLRPGRLEKHVYVGYPESDEEITDLLLKVAAKYSIDSAVLPSLSSPQFLQEFKKACPNYNRLSAADLKAAFDTAQLNAIHDLLQVDPSKQQVSIEKRHLMGALRSTRPSLPERDYGALMEAYRPFRKQVKGQEADNDAGSSGASSRTLRTALR